MYVHEKFSIFKINIISFKRKPLTQHHLVYLFQSGKYVFLMHQKKYVYKHIIIIISLYVKVNFLPYLFELNKIWMQPTKSQAQIKRIS